MMSYAPTLPIAKPIPERPEVGRDATHPRYTPSLDLSDRKTITELGTFLKAVNYPGAAVQQMLGKDFGAVNRRRDVPVLLRRLPASGALPALVKLFALLAPPATKRSSGSPCTIGS